MARSSRHTLTLALTFLLPLVSSQSSAPRLPTLDLSTLGTVGLAGSFAALQLHNPSSNSTSSSLSLDPSLSTLLTRDPLTGSLSPLATVSSPGNITSLCTHPSNGLLYIGGSFSFLSSSSSAGNRTTASNVVAWNSTTGTFLPLGGGLNGPVRALSCHAAEGKLYVGGAFTGPGGNGGPAVEGYAGNVAVWDTTTNEWSPPPFAGLNGAVSAIVPSEDRSSIFFGGSFTVPLSSSSSSGVAGGVNTTIASLPGSSIPSLGSSLVPVSLNGSDWNRWDLGGTGPTTYTSGYGRPQYIFCPAGEDGIGNSWLLVDGSVGRFTTVLDRAVNVAGWRIGNTFVGGRGTRTFSIVSIPDNVPQTLTYRTEPLNPSSPLATCTRCPLQHSPSIPYEDFLLLTPSLSPSPKLLTGFQLTILEHYGPGGGLHLLQLLSPGSFSYASPAASTGYTCTRGIGAQAAGSTATSSPQGVWETREIPVGDIPAAEEAVLVARVRADGSVTSSNSPSVTWRPYVASPGNYQIDLFTTGCDCDVSCGQRTIVQVVTTLPSGQTTSVNVDQRNRHNSNVTVYSGPLIPGQGTTITLSLADNAPRPAEGGTWVLYADRVELYANKTDVPQGSAGSEARGLWEYVVEGGQGAFGDAPQGSVTATNATQPGAAGNATGVDAVAMGLSIAGTALGTGVRAMMEVERESGKVLFVGGSFTYGSAAAAAAPSSAGGSNNASSNVLVYSPNAQRTVPSGGLNGPVTALAWTTVDNSSSSPIAYFGGSFTAAGSSSSTGSGAATFPGLVQWRWETPNAGWELLGNADDLAPLGGRVESLRIVQVRGRKVLLVAGGQGVSGRGLLAWDVEQQKWRTDVGFVVGALDVVGSNSTNPDAETVFIAGNVRAAAGASAPGAAYIAPAGEDDDDDDGAMVVPLQYDIVANETEGVDLLQRRRRSLIGVGFGTTVSLAARTLADVFSPAAHGHPPTVRRVKRAPSPGPTSVPSIFADLQSTTARVLAGTFYTNSSSSSSSSSDGDAQLTILGGRFETSTGVSNLAVYDSSSNQTRAVLPDGAEIDGEVRTLAVWKDKLWVGGRFGVMGGGMSQTMSQGMQGLTTVWLNNGTWDGTQSALVAYDGTNVTVNAISRRPAKGDSSSVVVIAGLFASAGSLPCPSVCLWDESQHRFESLGSGLAGTVTAVDFAGSDNEFLIVAGDLVYNSTRTFAARWSFDQQTWTAFGAQNAGVPGPATAVKANDGDDEAVFLAGTVSDAPGTPYLVRWDGRAWSDVGGSTLQPGSGVEQLMFVPISDRGQYSSLNPPPAGNGQQATPKLFDDDRMLLVSGALSLAAAGAGSVWNVSSALLDGAASWTPYLVSLGTAGGAGAIASFFFEKEGFTFGRKHFLSTALVILISAAISLGIVFFLALIGLLVALWHRPAQSQEYAIAPSRLAGGQDAGAAAQGGGQRIEPGMTGRQDVFFNAVKNLTDKGALGETKM